jgi:hypothetical protein
MIGKYNRAQEHPPTANFLDDAMEKKGRARLKAKSIKRIYIYITILLEKRF